MGSQDEPHVESDDPVLGGLAAHAVTYTPSGGPCDLAALLGGLVRGRAGVRVTGCVRAA